MIIQTILCDCFEVLHNLQPIGVRLKVICACRLHQDSDGGFVVHGCDCLEDVWLIGNVWESGADGQSPLICRQNLQAVMTVSTA